MNPSLLPSLAWFARIAHHRSFTRAADEMGVSRAALSQNLKALEKELGTRLLYRTTRDMSLTEAGQQLLDSLQPALRQIAHALHGLDAGGGAASGLVRINTSRLAARALIEPHLHEFQARHPGVRLELVMADGLSNIIADGCDAGIRLGRSLAENVVAVPVSPVLSMAVAGAPAYFERHGVPSTPAELAGHNCINYRYPSSGALHDWDFQDPAEGRHFTQCVSGNLTTNDCASMTNMALQGLGLIQIGDLSIRQHLLDRRLVRVLTDWNHTQAGFHLYTPAREHMPPALRALLDFLVEKRDTIAVL
ncbi:LysR family transcriptional regulator [Massilia sp. CFBP9012]|uniref:LysR family transcriptional regulator n=1 Tax=Massilia sp. CFBP9012 TaxID=3096531 RepID=UPI002A6B6661|nr:LysR family transcriptional regulator [Massilia sp. CFBP9012]MDY0977682.1 LysR family transcriptional regulator [Massilia sp. CFBP9012]